MRSRIKRKWKNVVERVRVYCKLRIQEKRERKKKSPYDCYVLMFHIITNDEDILRNDEFAISITSLIKLIEQLRGEGFEFICARDWLKKVQQKKILLTFDDAYEGVYSEFFPFAVKENIPFTVFQTICYLNKKMYLRKNQIEQMLNYKGFELGAHSITHKEFRFLDMEQIENEIIECKRELEETFKIQVNSFAFPYGTLVSIPSRAYKIASVMYDAVFFTVQTGVKKTKCKKFPRINVNERNWSDVLKVII